MSKRTLLDRLGITQKQLEKQIADAQRREAELEEALARDAEPELDEAWLEARSWGIKAPIRGN